MQTIVCSPTFVYRQVLPHTAQLVPAPTENDHTYLKEHCPYFILSSSFKPSLVSIKRKLRALEPRGRSQ